MTLTHADALALVSRDPALAREIVRRAEASGALERPYVSALFPAQRAFFNDTSKRKAALCSRRAGKTEGAGSWLLDGAEKAPGGLSVYIALTRNNARLILWNTLKRIDARHDLGLWFRELDGQLTVQLKNGHRIWLAGCKDASEVDKFRGIGGDKLAGITRAVIDEGQAYGGYLTALVEDALGPTLVDQDGELAIIGTPGPIPSGFFYEVTTGDSVSRRQWSTHHWTVLDNPFLKKAPADIIADELERFRGDESHPTFRREWLGEWVLDRGALVYPYDSSLNAWSGGLPQGDWTYGLGIDVGFNDDSAFVVGAIRYNHPEMYILYAKKHEGMIPSRMAAEVERLKGRWPINQVIVDTGGLGKGYAEEMRQKYGIPCEAAEKKHKRAAQSVLAGDLRSGLVKIDPHAAGCLVDEWMVLPWNAGRDAEDDRFPNHASDGALYLHRALRAYYDPQIEENTRKISDEFRAAIAKAKRKGRRR